MSLSQLGPPYMPRMARAETAVVHRSHPAGSSVGNCTTGALPDTQGSSPFRTHDFYLAAFLRCAGHDLIDLQPDGRRRVFVFRDSSRRRKDVLSFYNGTAKVDPLALSATIKDLKSLLHNA